MTPEAELAKLRQAADLTQEDLATQVGVSRTAVQGWERGAYRPSESKHRRKLAHALNVPRQQLDALLAGQISAEECLAHGRAAAMRTAIEPPSAITPSASTAEDDRIRHALDRPSSVDLVTVACLHDQVRALGERYDDVPSSALVVPASHLHARIQYLRTHARGSRCRKALFDAEAESGIVLSQLLWDASQRREHAAPRALLDEAESAARQGGDCTTQSYAVLRKAFLALYGERNPTKGIELAEQAAALARSASPALVGLASLHAAEGHGMAQNARA